MQFDLKQLATFVTVADEASFSRAAKVLGLAQASVSERIASLETAVGARLLDRTGHRVEPTRAGRLLLDRARQLLALRDETAAELRNLLDIRTGEVALGGSTAPGEYLLPRLIGTFAREHPGITVRLEIAASERILERVATGSLEIGLAGGRDGGDNLICKRTWRDRVVLVVPPGHEWAGRRQPVTGRQLAEQPWLVRERGSGTRSAAEKALRRVLRGGFDAVPIAAVLGSVSAIKEGVKAGLGISLLSELTVADDVRARAVATVPVADLKGERSFYLVRDRRRTLSPAAGALWKFLLEQARSTG